MIERNSLDQHINGINDFLEFQRISDKAVKEFENKQERIASLREQTKESIDRNQRKVLEKCLRIAKNKADTYAGQKIRKSRLIVCIATVAIYFAMILLGWAFQYTNVAVAIVLAGICAVIIFLFLRPGYATGQREKYKKKEWNEIYESCEIKDEMQKAKEADNEETRIKQRRIKEELSRLENQEGTYEWLYKEWEKIVRDIRGQAYLRGIGQYMNQTDGALIKIVVQKTYFDANSATATYRTVMQKAKEKAIRDWQECAKLTERMNDMLDSIFR